MTLSLSSTIRSNVASTLMKRVWQDLQRELTGRLGELEAFRTRESSLMREKGELRRQLDEAILESEAASSLGASCVVTSIGWAVVD